MGNGSSVSGEEDPLDPFDGIDTLGYRVLGVQPDSPAAAAGLVSFLDFLVGVNDKMLLGSGEDLQPGEEYDDVDLPAILEENKGQEVEFCTFRAKTLSSKNFFLTIEVYPNSGLEYQESNRSACKAHSQRYMGWSRSFGCDNTAG